MTAAVVATPVRAPDPRGLDRTDRRPRLLLPPPAEPPGVPLTAVMDGALPARCRSVLSPLTDQHWPFAAPTPPEPATAKLPDPRQICGAVVLAAVEALRSARPLAQLIRWVTPEVFDALARAAVPAPPGNRARAVVRGLRICRIGPGIAEGSVVIHDGPRVRAAAVRMEAHRGSWRVTVLQIG